MNLSLIIYIAAFVQFVTAGVYNWQGLDWSWMAYCSLYMMSISIWSKIN